MKIDRLHFGAALAFAASAAITMAWCGSMSAMPGMQMRGGWTMSMAWMRMPDHGWGGYAGSFLGMWAVMMVAMMLPAFTSMLARYRRAVAGPANGALMARVIAGYFAVWTLLGAMLFPVGVLSAELLMRLPVLDMSAPTLAAAVVLAAGASQFTVWKTRRLTGCRHTLDCCHDTRPHYRDAWRHGFRLGLRCVYCCAGLTAVLLVTGVMDLRAMAGVTAAISVERLMPARIRPERAVGACLLIAGVWLLIDSVA